MLAIFSQYSFAINNNTPKITLSLSSQAFPIILSDSVRFLSLPHKKAICGDPITLWMTITKK